MGSEMFFMFFIALGLVTVTQCLMLGGWSEMDVAANDEGLMNAANWATNEISKDRDSNNRLKLLQIIHAKSQVGLRASCVLEVGCNICVFFYFHFKSAL